MKKIGFLSFGHWADHPSYKARTASDTLLQSIDLAVAAEEIGLDGAYFRVHHFARQLASSTIYKGFSYRISITPVPISIRLVLAPIAESKGKGDANCRAK